MAVSKPLPGQPIDRTAPLAQNVASFWALNEGGGTAFLDSAGNSPGAASGVVVRSQGGVVFSGASYIALDSGKENLEANKKFSFVARIKTTTAANCAIAATWASGSKAGFYILLNSSGAGIFSVGMASASNAAYIQKDTSKSVVDGKEHTIGFDYDGSQTLAGLKIFIDGLEIGGTTNYIAGTIGAFSHTGFNLGANGAGGIKYVGTLGYAGLFVGGNLGAAGHAAIAANPWQLWPDDQIVFAPASGINVTPDPATLTLTGYAPTVTAPAAVTPTPASLTLTGYAPTVTAPASITPTPATLTLTGYPPTVTTSAATNDSEWIITARRRGRR